MARWLLILGFIVRGANERLTGESKCQSAK
jgi:hypothetical protein